MATGYLGSSGVSTYFKNGPISLGVTMSANNYPNGTITFSNMGQTTCWFHNGHVDGQVLTLYLCDSNGNNAKKLCDLTVPGNTNVWTMPTMTISGATGLAGKALYIKATGTDLALNRVYIRNRTAINIPTASVAHSITCSAGTGGSLTADKSSAAQGATVTLTPTPATGYQFSGYTSSPSVTITNNKFTMPNQNITITATFSKINYTITKGTSPSGAGTVTAPATAQYGNSVSVSQTPATGYYFNGWQTSPALTISGGAFTMPASNVSITAKYLRRSTASLNKTTLTGNDNAVLSISTENTAYSHKYKLSFGTNMETGWVNVAAGTTSVTISIPESWSNYIPNATTKTGGTLVVETYSGSTKIGEYTISGLTYAVPANATPTMGTITTSIARTIGGKTYANVGNYYVQKHCGVRIQASASSKLSASIVTMKAELVGYSGGAYSATVSGGSIDFTSGLLLQAGTAQIKVTATDSRGKTVTGTANISVTAYNAPDGILTVRRVNAGGDDDDTGTYGKYSLSKAYSAVGSNSLTVTLTSQGTSQTISADAGDILPGNRQTFSVQQEYTIQVKLQDAFETVTLQTKLRSAKFIIYVSADGNKLGLMKAATKAIPAGKNATIELSGDAQLYIGDDKFEPADYQKALAVVADGDTHEAVTVGDIIYVKNNTHGLTDGMYFSTAEIATNGSISSSNTTPITSGIMNKFRGSVEARNTPTDLNNAVYAGCYMFNTGTLNKPGSMSYGLCLTVTTRNPTSSGIGWIIQFAVSTATNTQTAIRKRINNGSWTEWTIISKRIVRKIKTYSNVTITDNNNPYVLIDDYSGLGISNTYYCISMNIRGWTNSTVGCFNIMKGSAGGNFYLLGSKAGSISSVTVEYFFSDNAEEL